MRTDNFADIHCHLLFGLDDGPKTSEESIEMMGQAYSQGVRRIFATPHYIPEEAEPEPDLMRRRLSELQAAAEKQFPGLVLYTGSEIFLTPEVPDIVGQKPYLRLNESSYVLVELPMLNFPLYAEQVLYELQLKGYMPIIAHPERNVIFCGNPDKLIPYLERGILTQVNAGSLVGSYGADVRKAAWQMIERNMVYFVGSDSHRLHSRRNHMKEAFRQVSERIGLEAANRLFCTNSEKIIANDKIDFISPVHRPNSGINLGMKLIKKIIRND